MASSKFALADMPADVVYEILLRVPAKDLCRFRTVCRPWHSLLSDPQFIAAHAAHQPDPLLVYGYHATDRNHGLLCDIMDLSGRVHKRVRSWTWSHDDVLLFTLQEYDLIFTPIRRNSRSFTLLNPADGAVHALPEGFAEEHAEAEAEADDIWHDAVAFGQTASTGLYKALRVVELFNQGQLCEVFTLDGSTDSRWRGKEAPPDHIDTTMMEPSYHHLQMTQSRVVVNGVVYFFAKKKFLLDQDYYHVHLPDQDAAPKRIASFDLGTEEWRASIQGPQINLVDGGAAPMGINEGVQMYGDGCSMAALNGSLVVVHCNHLSTDLWFLTDFEKGLWIKKHSIVYLSRVSHEFSIRPLLVLNDGRILSYVLPGAFLRIYDPRTNTYTSEAQLPPHIGVGLYTGSLLSLAAGANN